MKRVELRHIPVRRPNPFAGWEHKLHGVFLVMFGVGLALVWVRLWLRTSLFGEARWPEGLLLVLAAATTLASLSRHLPAQNVILAAVLIGGFAGAAEALSAVTAIPFGPFVYNTANIGPLLSYPFPWAVPVIWVVVILNARGVARLILRPHRHRPNYGLWVIGLTTALVVVFELSFEPYASVVRQYWCWKPTRLPSTWYATPWTNFLGAAVTSLLILLFATPALINKSPIKPPPEWHPLMVWQLLGLLFLAGAVTHHLWRAACLDAAQLILVLLWSILGTRLESRFRLRNEPQPGDIRTT